MTAHRLRHLTLASVVWAHPRGSHPACTGAEPTGIYLCALGVGNSRRRRAECTRVIGTRSRDLPASIGRDGDPDHIPPPGQAPQANSRAGARAAHDGNATAVDIDAHSTVDQTLPLTNVDREIIAADAYAVRRHRHDTAGAANRRFCQSFATRGTRRLGFPGHGLLGQTFRASKDKFGPDRKTPIRARSRQSQIGDRLPAHRARRAEGGVDPLKGHIRHFWQNVEQRHLSDQLKASAVKTTRIDESDRQRRFRPRSARATCRGTSGRAPDPRRAQSTVAPRCSPGRVRC